MPEWMTPLLRRLVTRPGSPSFSSTTTVRSRARSLARAHPTTPAPTMTTETFSKWGLSGEKALRTRRGHVVEPGTAAREPAEFEGTGSKVQASGNSPGTDPRGVDRPPSAFESRAPGPTEQDARRAQAPRSSGRMRSRRAGGGDVARWRRGSHNE